MSRFPSAAAGAATPSAHGVPSSCAPTSRRFHDPRGGTRATARQPLHPAERGRQHQGRTLRAGAQVPDAEQPTLRHRDPQHPHGRAAHRVLARPRRPPREQSHCSR
ncbi:hypothetical protein ACFPRL_07050 [Pseudoclavibacter helvolus]